MVRLPLFVMKIEQKYIDILQSGKSDKNKYYLPANLDRKDYVAVNKVLESLGGKWTKGVKAHVFPSDFKNLLNETLGAGEYKDLKEEKDKYQFFQTPIEVSQRLARYAVEILVDQNIKQINLLEPSVGYGNLVDGLLSTLDNSGLEINYACLIDIQVENLTKVAKKYSNEPRLPNLDTVQGDFPTLGSEDILFAPNLVLMNPPFKNGADIKHIRHAYNILRPNGVLAAICGEGAMVNTRKNEREFQKWVDDIGASVYDIEAGAFKESGTDVKTRMIVVYKMP